MKGTCHQRCPSHLYSYAQKMFCHYLPSRSRPCYWDWTYLWSLPPMRQFWKDSSYCRRSHYLHQISFLHSDLHRRFAHWTCLICRLMDSHYHHQPYLGKIYDLWFISNRYYSPRAFSLYFCYLSSYLEQDSIQSWRFHFAPTSVDSQVPLPDWSEFSSCRWDFYYRMNQRFEMICPPILSPEPIYLWVLRGSSQTS